MSIHAIAFKLASQSVTFPPAISCQMAARVQDVQLPGHTAGTEVSPAIGALVREVDGALTAALRAVESVLAVGSLPSVQDCAFLWEQDVAQELEAFAASGPALEEYVDRLALFDRLEAGVQTKVSFVRHGAFQVDARPLTAELLAELGAWRGALTSRLRDEGAAALRELSARLEGLTAGLDRPVEDLEDFRLVSETLAAVRELEADFEAQIEPAECIYQILARADVSVPKAETDLLLDLRYSWKKLLAMAQEMANVLLREQARKESYLVWGRFSHWA